MWLAFGMRLRGQWLVLTPEEWVRQHMIRYLIEKRGVEAHYIVQEYPVSLGGMAQRADIVVLDKEGRPALLVECKAPEVPVSRLKNRGVFDQAVRYNSGGGGLFCGRDERYGARMLCPESESLHYAPCEALPDFSVFLWGFSSWSMYSSCQSAVVRVHSLLSPMIEKPLLLNRERLRRLFEAMLQ